MINNKNGFTLVQVMVAAAILGGLSLAFMQLVSNMNQAQTFAQSQGDEIELKTSIRTILDNEKFCRISLAGDGPVGFPTNPVVFRKDLNDEENAVAEGIDISLFLANQAGDTRTLKKFNGSDNPGLDDKSEFGNLTIKSMKLYMNNTVGGDYADSPAHNDIGILRVLVDKKISRTTKRGMTFDFNVNVGMSTGVAPELSGETRILSCEKEEAVSNMPVPWAIAEISLAGAIIYKSDNILSVVKSGDNYTVQTVPNPNGTNYRVFATAMNNEVTTINITSRTANDFVLTPYRKTGGGSNVTTSVSINILIY